MHKSQGFGAGLYKGDRWEYLELIKGDAFEFDALDDIDLSWSRIGVSKGLTTKISIASGEFDPYDPAASVNSLLEIRKMIAEVKDPHWREIKLKEVDALIMDCLGIQVEVLSEEAILDWAEERRKAADDGNDNTPPAVLKLFQLESVQDFLEWLEEDDDDSDDSDDDDSE